MLLVGRSPTFAYWRKVGYQAYNPSADSVSGLFVIIAHICYQMGTNPGIGLIPDLPPIRLY